MARGAGSRDLDSGYRAHLNCLQDLTQNHMSVPNITQVLHDKPKLDNADKTAPKTLECLAEENSSMKEEIESKLGLLMEYKLMVEEYSEKIEVEYEQTKELQQTLEQQTEKSLFAMVTGPSN